MNIKKQMKFLSCAFVALCCAGMIGACGDDEEEEKEHNWHVSLPSTIVANGDYLTTSVYGSSDYDFKMEYYWDGTLIQTTDKNTGLNFLVSNQTTGDHKLKIVFTGDAIGTEEYFVQVYEKERGFLGCSLIPNNRELKNGDKLQGEVVYYPSTSDQGYLMNNTSEVHTYVKWAGTIKSVNLWIDDDKGNAVQTINSAPWNFNIPINSLSKGQHKLIMKVEGVGLEHKSIGPGNVVSGTLDLPIEYIFTVTQ